MLCHLWFWIYIIHLMQQMQIHHVFYDKLDEYLYYYVNDQLNCHWYWYFMMNWTIITPIKEHSSIGRDSCTWFVSQSDGCCKEGDDWDLDLFVKWLERRLPALKEVGIQSIPTLKPHWSFSTIFIFCILETTWYNVGNCCYQKIVKDVKRKEYNINIIRLEKY